MTTSRAHARTCEDLDPDLADAVSTMLLAVAANLKVATPRCYHLVTRNRLTDAHEQLLEAAQSLAKKTDTAAPSVEACSAIKLIEAHERNSLLNL